MADEIGIKVLHPGGYAATRTLCDYCCITEDDTVLDIACGIGTTSKYLHETFGCSVTGIDISEKLINKAKESLTTQSLQSHVTFQKADALCLPYPDNSFDAVIAQAFFVLIDNKEKALDEIQRVLKPGGYFGAIELSWHQPPSETIFAEIRKHTCNDLIPRVQTFEMWEKFFSSHELLPQTLQRRKMESGMLKMIRSEGVINFMKIMTKMMKSTNRSKMMKVQKTFKKYENYLGYGIYCLRKAN